MSQEKNDAKGRNGVDIIDVRDRLIHIDEVGLLEVLDISAEDIVDKFMDRIEGYEDLAEELADARDDDE